jgi:hypothetical protein
LDGGGQIQWLFPHTGLLVYKFNDYRDQLIVHFTLY